MGASRPTVAKSIVEFFLVMLLILNEGSYITLHGGRIISNNPILKLHGGHEGIGTPLSSRGTRSPYSIGRSAAGNRDSSSPRGSERNSDGDTQGSDVDHEVNEPLVSSWRDLDLNSDKDSYSEEKSSSSPIPPSLVLEKGGRDRSTDAAQSPLKPLNETPGDTEGVPAVPTTPRTAHANSVEPPNTAQRKRMCMSRMGYTGTLEQGREAASQLLFTDTQRRKQAHLSRLDGEAGCRLQAHRQSAGCRGDAAAPAGPGGSPQPDSDTPDTASMSPQHRGSESVAETVRKKRACISRLGLREDNCWPQPGGGSRTVEAPAPQENKVKASAASAATAAVSRAEGPGPPPTAAKKRIFLSRLRAAEDREATGIQDTQAEFNK